MLRLIGQYLYFSGTYTQLSRESGITLEHNDATELRHAILEGRWFDAEAAIDKLAPMIGDLNSVEEVRFLILEQQFLENLEANEVMPAVTLLRNRITPMQRNTERVHTLASCLMCRTAVELQAQAGGWAGVDAGSRLQLINRIQAFIPAQTMLPPGRLEELINESVRAQLASCIFHNPPMGVQTDINNISLLQRHSCGMQDFPAFCIQTLDHQRDSDLWFCQFSPDGSYLATGGKDANVDVWRVDSVRHAVSFFRVLTTPAYIGCLCWSPDSKKLAACCGEEQSSILVFDVFSGQQLCSQKVNDEDVYSTASFFSDSRKLAFGGLKGSFYVMVTNGLLQNGSTNDAVNNRSENQIDQLLVADSLHRIRLFRFGLVCSNTTLFKETHPVQSIMISRSGTMALLTIHKMGLHLWDLEACAILQRFVGHKQDTFRLYSTFGGANEDFVATGSENGRIHIWHVGSGSHPIHSSPGTGNRDPITCVHWNPVLPTMIASVNDAGELCIWGPQRYALGNGQPMDSST
ncbi:putative wd-repeat protein [Schistosoma mansoni]|uniref:putative wd-repeat protein n=1 Tax=Schistosoma mansoni TaxID=6183 RepID=UPI00022DC9FC|nr:putative wd-repeat protein [Schistosoma mansoni]|eukprot:XP_018655675.1 putative wd-repeat protein [Schistosoma mansoni]